MPDLRPILHLNGVLLTGLAVLMLIPAMVDLAYDDSDWLVFWASAIATGFFGIALILANRAKQLTTSQPSSKLRLRSARGSALATIGSEAGCGAIAIGNVRPAPGDHRQHSTVVIIQGNVVNTNNDC